MYVFYHMHIWVWQSGVDAELAQYSGSMDQDQVVCWEYK